LIETPAEAGAIDIGEIMGLDLPIRDSRAPPSLIAWRKNSRCKRK
jgi:hypothetical protein